MSREGCAENEAYFNEVVDPLFRPLMAKLQKDKPSSDELADFVADFFRETQGFKNKQAEISGRSGLQKGRSINSQTKDNEEVKPSAKNASLESELPPAPPGLEMDSAVAEDAVDLKHLLLPPGFDPLASLDAQADKFALCYSKRALEGWVKQPSPCCAAASAAGAWNACVGVGRRDERAQAHTTLVPVFSAMLQDQVDAKRAKIERMLDSSGAGFGAITGGAFRCDLGPLLDAVRQRLKEDGDRRLGGKGDQGPGPRKHLLRLVREATKQARAEAKLRDQETAAAAAAQAASVVVSAGDVEESLGSNGGKDKPPLTSLDGACAPSARGGGGGAPGDQVFGGSGGSGDERPLTGSGYYAFSQPHEDGHAAAAASSSAAWDLNGGAPSSPPWPAQSSCPAVFQRLGELYDEEEAELKAQREAAATAAAAAAEAAEKEGGEQVGAFGAALAEIEDLLIEGYDEDEDDGYEEEDEEEADAGDEKAIAATVEAIVSRGADGEGKSDGVPLTWAEQPEALQSSSGGGDSEGKDEGAEGDASKKAKKDGKGKAKKKKVKGKKAGAGRKLSWRKEIGEWLHKEGGLEKINAPRPSTAPFGNWGVMGALRRLNDGRFDVDVVGSLFMGKKSRASADSAAAAAKAASAAPSSSALQALPSYVALSRDDDEGAVSRQWGLLRSAFLRRDACLIFHLKNHYALIFALREWVEPVEEHTHGKENSGSDRAAAATDKPTEERKTGQQWHSVSGELLYGDEAKEGNEDGEPPPPGAVPLPQPPPPPRRGKVVRQLLTSRRGQRPSAWVDFEEARQTMLGWDGYKIMLVERRA